MKRNKAYPRIELKIWKRDEKLWYAEKYDIQDAIQKSRNTEEIIRKRMGAGYHLLEDALNGKRLRDWDIAHIEMGLCSDGRLPVEPPMW